MIIFLKLKNTHKRNKHFTFSVFTNDGVSASATKRDLVVKVTSFPLSDDVRGSIRIICDVTVPSATDEKVA